MKEKLLDILGLNSTDFKALRIEYDGIVIKRIKDGKIDKIRY